MTDKIKLPEDFDRGRADYPRGDVMDEEQRNILQKLREKEKPTPIEAEILWGLVRLEKLQNEGTKFSDAFDL